LITRDLPVLACPTNDLGIDVGGIRSSQIPDDRSVEAQLGRTVQRRRHDVLAFFDHHASNGPTEAIDGGREALRRSALGFRNLNHHRIRSLLHCGNLTRQIDAL
jgi:transposase